MGIGWPVGRLAGSQAAGIWLGRVSRFALLDALCHVLSGEAKAEGGWVGRWGENKLASSPAHSRPTGPTHRGEGRTPKRTEEEAGCQIGGRLLYGPVSVSSFVFLCLFLHCSATHPPSPPSSSSCHPPSLGSQHSLSLCGYLPNTHCIIPHFFSRNRHM